MEYVVEAKPGLFYAYRSVRLPGRKHPVKECIGPAKFIDEETAEFRGKIYNVRKKRGVDLEAEEREM